MFDPTAVMRMLDARSWRIERDRSAVPRIEVVHKDRLEVFDGIEWAIQGNDVRLYTSRSDRRIFAAVFASSQAEQARTLQSTRRRTVLSFRGCTVVLPSRVLSRRDFDDLERGQWTRDVLRERWGAWSYWEHWHGVGFVFLTYVPEGFEVTLADSRTGRYYLVDINGDWSDERKVAAEGPPEATALHYEDYRRMRRTVRRKVARMLCAQRERIDAALARGLKSPDGRFVVAPVNVGGGYNVQETAIREIGKPERRYSVGYWTRLGDYCWLDQRTVLQKVDSSDRFSVYTLDAMSGKRTPMPDLAATVSEGRIGCLGNRRIWYATADGVRHEQVVPDARSETTQPR